MGTAALWLAGIVCALGISGCAILNEGLVDYRRAVKTTPCPDPGNATAPCKTVRLTPKYSLPSEPGIYIEAGQTVSIALKRAFIKDFVEWPAFLGRGETHARGEVAIVARVFELGSGEGADFNYAPDAAKSGRLVFFSADARKQQAALNMSYLPIYGPTQYNGNPLCLQLYVFELDAESPAARNLLKTLAKLGASYYPPASPVLGVLDVLGSALLQGSHDDTLLSYTMTLLANQPAGYPYPILQAGDYVFVRKEDRPQPFDWTSVALDPADGSLVQQGSSPAQPFTAESYLTLQIQRNLFPGSLALSNNTFADFQAKIAKLQTEKAEQSAKTFAELDKYVEEFKSRHMVDRRSRDIQTGIDLLQVAGYADAQRQESAYRVLTALKQNLEELDACAKDTTKTCRGVLSREQIAASLGKLRLLPGVAGDNELLARLTEERLKKETDLTGLASLVRDRVTTARGH